MGSAAAAPILTPLLVSPSDLKRARREVETLDEFLHQAGLRQGGKAVKLPATSRVLLEMAEESKLNLLKKTDRDRLLKFLAVLTAKAPVIHMSFASEPSAAFMNKLIVWLRENIHPQIVVSVGLQPSIAAGCIVRTANTQYDFSLRQSLENQTDVFIAGLKDGMEIPGNAFEAAPISTAGVEPAIAPESAAKTGATAMAGGAAARQATAATKPVPAPDAVAAEPAKAEKRS